MKRRQYRKEKVPKSTAPATQRCIANLCSLRVLRNNAQQQHAALRNLRLAW